MILIGTTLLGCLFLGDIYNATSVIWNGKFSYWDTYDMYSNYISFGLVSIW